MSDLRKVYSDPSVDIAEPNPDWDFTGDDAVRWDIGFDCAVTFSWDYEETNRGLYVVVSQTKGPTEQRTVTPGQLREFASGLTSLADRAEERLAGGAA